jgi:hypothetical protein
MFHHDSRHTGSLAGTNTSEISCEAPFPNNGEFSFSGQFSFSVVGPTNSTNWVVFASTNLIDWTNTGSTVDLDSTGTANFTDPNSSDANAVFYYLSNECCSRAIGFIALNTQLGTNFIADPFYQISDVVTVPSTQAAFPPMNTVGAVFSGVTEFDGDFPTCLPGTNVIGWNGHGYITNTSSVNFTWSPNGDIPLLPGNAAISDVGTNPVAQPVWFVGLIPEAVTNQIVPGTNFLGSALPMAGGI